MWVQRGAVLILHALQGNEQVATDLTRPAKFCIVRFGCWFGAPTAPPATRPMTLLGRAHSGGSDLASHAAMPRQLPQHAGGGGAGW